MGLLNVSLLLSSFFLLVTGQFASAQNGTGYIDLKRVMYALPETPGLIHRQDSLQLHLHDSARILQDKYFDFLNNEIPYSGKKDTAIIQLYITKIDSMQRIMREYDHYAHQRLAEESGRIDSILRKKIEQELKAFCTQEKIKSVSTREAVLYCKECIDYTEEFILYLQEK